MLRPSGLESMNSAQQYQKLIALRAQTAQMSREDQAMREYQRLTQQMHAPTRRQVEDFKRNKGNKKKQKNERNKFEKALARFSVERAL